MFLGEKVYYRFITKSEFEEEYAVICSQCTGKLLWWDDDDGDIDDEDDDDDDVSGTVLSVLYELSRVTSLAVLGNRFHSNSHFTDEEIEACMVYNLSSSFSY